MLLAFSANDGAAILGQMDVENQIGKVMMELFSQDYEIGNETGEL
jgi:chaperonin GroEL (HSP60 family)